MKQLNSHMFESVYERLGINLDTLGCVMLDLDKIERPASISNDLLYETKHLDRKWINGWVCGETPHITLLYGLMQNAHLWEVEIEKVLRDWNLNRVTVDYVDFFESPYKDDPYYCIVAHIKVDTNLLEGHERLELLPHINTFTGYKPHMTLCYVKKDTRVRDMVIKELNKKLQGKTLKVLPKINLGYEPE